MESDCYQVVSYSLVVEYSQSKDYWDFARNSLLHNLHKVVSEVVSKGKIRGLVMEGVMLVVQEI